MKDSFQKILVFNTAFPGDIILTTPLIRAVRERFPESHLAFCTTPAGENLLSGLSLLDNLIVYDKHGRHRGITGVFKTARSLRKEKFDLVLSCHRSFRSAVLLAMGKIPLRVGFRQSAFPALYNITVPRDIKAHETVRNLSLLQPFDIDPASVSTHPVLPVSDQEAGQLFSRLTESLPKGAGPVIMVFPGSVWGTKRWLAERFAALADCLAELYAARILVAGSSQDRQQADQMLAACKTPVLDLVGKTNLRELCGLVYKSDLVVTGDSAPMHIAWAFDIPTVAIFGATVPELGFAPLSQKCRIVQVENLECRPCSDHGPKQCPFEHFRCMKDISVEMVLDACSRLLESGNRE